MASVGSRSRNPECGSEVVGFFFFDVFVSLRFQRLGDGRGVGFLGSGS